MAIRVPRSVVEAIQMLVRPVSTRVSNLVQRAVVTLVDDAHKLQELQLRAVADAVRDRCERFQQYGFTSVPLEGAEAVVLFVGGYADHPLVIAVDDRRYRPQGLKPGEVALYTDEGDQIRIKRGGTIEITSATKVVVSSPEIEATSSIKVTVTAPEVELAGSTKAVLTAPLVQLGDDTAAQALALATQVNAELDAIRAAYAGHTHLYAPGPGAPVATPGPVPTLVGGSASVASSTAKAKD